VDGGKLIVVSKSKVKAFSVVESISRDPEVEADVDDVERIFTFVRSPSSLNVLVLGIASLVDTGVKTVDGNSIAAEETVEVDISGTLVVFDVAEEEVLVWLELLVVVNKATGVGVENNFEVESCEVSIAVEELEEVDGLLVVIDCETNKIGNVVTVDLINSSFACVGDEVVCKVLGVNNRVDEVAELPCRFTNDSELTVVGCLVVRTSTGNPEILNFQAAGDCRLRERSLV